jgi:hypothetical protein
MSKPWAVLATIGGILSLLVFLLKLYLWWKPLGIGACLVTFLAAGVAAWGWARRRWISRIHHDTVNQ